MSGGRAETGRERIPSRLRTVSTEPRDSVSQTVISCPELKSTVRHLTN